MRVAIIDLGTNTFHLLICEVSEFSRDILYKKRKAVRIGQGGIGNKIITAEAQARAMQTLSEFSDTVKEFKADQIIATATSAFRNAKNGKQLAENIKRKLSIPVQIISGKKEATLIYKGVKQAVQMREEPDLIMDIGGGSVEFILASNSRIFWKDSYEIGAQRLMDMFHKHDPISGEDIARVFHYLDKKLKKLEEQIKAYNPKFLIGASGTFDTLIDILYKKSNQVKPSGPSYELRLQDFREIYLQITSSDHEKRLTIPGMLPMRVDMIVVACCLIQYVINKQSPEIIKTSVYSLKEGLLADSLKKLRKEIVSVN